MRGSSDNGAHSADVTNEDLLLHHSLPIQPQATKVFLPQGCNQQIPPPSRERVTLVEVDIAHGNRRRPVQDRIFDSGHLLRRRDGLAVVLDAVAYQGPSIVRPRVE